MIFYLVSQILLKLLLIKLIFLHFSSKDQATEIGASAVSFLINTWEGHLTPQEAASIADKASRGRDNETIRQAAKLALSCLPHAQALNPNEIQRAIIQVLLIIFYYGKLLRNYLLAKYL